MSARDAARLVRVANVSFVQGLSAKALGVGFMLGVLALIGYCLGHALFNAEELHWLSSLRWGLSRACGIGLLLVSGYQLRSHHWLLRLFGPLIAAVICSGIVSALLGAPGFPGYSMLGAYLVLSIASALLLAPAPDLQCLELDFGRSRRMVPVAAIVAAHAARNYVEIDVDGCDRPGLLRMTLEQLLARLPGLLVRTHRSHLVNPVKVKTIEAGPRGSLRLHLSNDGEVPVSPRHVAAVRFRVTAVPGCGISSQEPSGTA